MLVWWPSWPPQYDCPKALWEVRSSGFASRSSMLRARISLMSAMVWAETASSASRPAAAAMGIMAGRLPGIPRGQTPDFCPVRVAGVPIRLGIVLPSVLAAVLALAGCGDDPSEGPDAEPTGQSSSSAPERVAAGVDPAARAHADGRAGGR